MHIACGDWMSGSLKCPPSATNAGSFGSRGTRSRASAALSDRWAPIQRMGARRLPWQCGFYAVAAARMECDFLNADGLDGSVPDLDDRSSFQFAAGEWICYGIEWHSCRNWRATVAEPNQ